ncbi:MAG: glycosyl hydrolase [bacterium]|nr:glycosyl hydrolase [bacterium]
MHMRRVAIYTFLWVMIFLLLMGGKFAQTEYGEQDDGSAVAPQVMREPYAMFGIDIEDIADDRIDEELDAAASTGAAWIRIYAMWKFIEPEPPHEAFRNGQWGTFTGRHRYNWSHVDRIVDAARDRGLNVYLTNMLPPPWANGADPNCNAFIGEDLSCGNVIYDPHWYTDFVYNEAAHFKGRVRYYGVWNEPNDGHFFNGPRDGTYLNVFMATYVLGAREALRAADPEAKLVGPELSMGTGIPNSNADWADGWLEPMLKYFGRVFDVVSIHNHSNSHENAKRNAERARRIIERYAPGTEFWMTEFGADTCALTQTKQAEQLFGVYIDTINRPWWTKTFYYALTDHDPAKSCGAGLFTGADNGFTPRPAYWEYRRITGYDQ